MNINIEAFPEFVMIGTQRVDRPADVPRHVWLEEWDEIVRRRKQGKSLCHRCDRFIVRW